MAKKQSKEAVKEARGKRAHEEGERAHKASEPAREARDIRNESIKEEAKARRMAQIDLMAEEEESGRKRISAGQGKVTLHDGKPGSGAGLRPGQLHAPKSNPGAAAAVPNQPLQPESLQSHGLGILYDKDLDNPPYDVGDPEATDEGPSGSGSASNAHAHSRTIDKQLERKKAEKATPRSKQLDPDNPAIGRGGKKDATASPEPIGTRNGSKNAQAGGSNPGTDAD